MTSTEDRPCKNTVAVPATMHAKEPVIGPILRDELGLIVGLAMGVNTDQFGTLSREVARTESQLDAARAKIAAGFVYALLARVSIISEGSFGLHPHVSFVAFGREPVLMIDREAGLELTGYDASPETNFGPAVARDLDEAMSFADRARFPTHGLIVIGCKAEPPAPALFLNKEIVNGAALEAVAKDAIRICGAAFVEIDMRDHQNPTRMAAIERATRDVARRFHSRCLNCDDLGIRRD